jgi:hypothetical protein
MWLMKARVLARMMTSVAGVVALAAVAGAGHKWW